MVVDFAELRSRILAGEEDATEDALPTPLRTELREDNSTLFSILFGGALLGVSMMDRAKHDGAIFTTQNGNSYGPLADALGFGSLMFGLGRLSRGLSAQDEINNYERLVEEAENIVLDAEAEVEETEAALIDAPDPVQSAFASATEFFRTSVLNTTKNLK